MDIVSHDAFQMDNYIVMVEAVVLAFYYIYTQSGDCVCVRSLLLHTHTIIHRGVGGTVCTVHVHFTYQIKIPPWLHVRRVFSI